MMGTEVEMKALLQSPDGTDTLTPKVNVETTTSVYSSSYKLTLALVVRHYVDHFIIHFAFLCDPQWEWKQTNTIDIHFWGWGHNWSDIRAALYWCSSRQQRVDRQPCSRGGSQRCATAVYNCDFRSTDCDVVDVS